MKQLNLKDLQSDNPHVKYHCAKQAIAQSEKNPRKLYPKLKTFINLLDSENNVLKWTSLIVIGNLAAVDAKGTITKLVPRLIAYTKDPSLITAGNASKALGKIARQKPRLRNKIFHALLGVEKITYYNKGKPSPECRTIIIGHVINVLADFKETIKGNKAIIAWLKRQIKNTRPTVKKRAKGLLSAIN